MKNWLRSSGVVGALLFSLLACSGGGYRSPSGHVCPSVGYDPLPMELNKDNKPDAPRKLKLDGGDEGLKTFAGKFQYNGAEIYYREARSGMQIHVSDAYSERTKKIESNTICVNGFKPGGGNNGEPFFSGLSLSTFQVDEAGGIQFQVREFLLDFQENLLVRKFGEDQTASPDLHQPGMVYERSGFDYQLYKMNAAAEPSKSTDFELRSHAIVGKNQAEISVVVRFKRSPNGNTP